jgi:hypothetical protein
MRLVWVSPDSLPVPVEAFDLDDPAHEREIRFFDQTLNFSLFAAQPHEYPQKMPDFWRFLTHGLQNGLELVLTEKRKGATAL